MQFQATVKMLGGAVVAGKRTETRRFETLARAMQFVAETRYCDSAAFSIAAIDDFGDAAVLMHGGVDCRLLVDAQADAARRAA